MKNKILLFFYIYVFIFISCFEKILAQDKRIKVIIIESKNFPLYQDDKLEQYLKKMLKDISIKKYFSNDKEAINIIRKLNINTLPAVLIDNKVENISEYNKFKETGMIQKTTDNYYILSKDISGVSEFLNRKKVLNVMDIFIFSKCQYVANFLKELILGFRNGLINKEVKLRNIYYLIDAQREIKMVQNKNNNSMIQNIKYNFKSSFGIVDVEESRIQLIIKKYYPDKYYDYILLRTQNIESSLWGIYASELGMNLEFILKKVQEEGDKLLADNIISQDNLNIKISPAVLWCNKYLIIDLRQLNKIKEFENLNIKYEGSCK